MFLKKLSNELKLNIRKFADDTNNIKKQFFTPCLPDWKTIPVRQADGRLVFERNPDYGVDKILEKILPLVSGDNELAKEIIIKLHRKNPDIEFQELLSMVQKQLKTKQTAMTTGMREQYVPRRTYNPEIARTEEKTAADLYREEQLRLQKLYDSKIQIALHNFAAYDLRKVSKEGPNGARIIYEGQKTIGGRSVDITDKGDVIFKIVAYAIDEFEAKIRKALKDYAAYDLKKVYRECPDGTYIIYEGQRTIAGMSVDINNRGDVLVKRVLERTIPNANIPDNVMKMIDSMFMYYPQHKIRACEIAKQVLEKNPNVSLDEIGIAIKESFR